MFTIPKCLFFINTKRFKIVFFIILFSFIVRIILPRVEFEDQDDLQVSITLPTDKVHIFYDAWYRTKKTDQYNQGWFEGSKDVLTLGSAFYPKEGLYSANDPKIIDLHMKQIRDAGVGVVVVSWWPKKHVYSPPLPLILNCSQRYGLKVTIHIQKYADRTADSIITNVKRVLRRYGNHTAFYKQKLPTKTRPLPMIYIYESLQIKPEFWNELLHPAGKRTIRETKYDAIFIGLIIDETDKYLVANSDFDGFYTLFSHFNFTYSSTWYRWPYIEDFAIDRQLIFIPTVSPGYDYRLSRTGVNPLLIPPITGRQSGNFYQKAWLRAVISRSRFVSINSFNGWLTGTQIEPVRMTDKLDKNKTSGFKDYSPGTSNQYLDITRRWVIEFANRSLYRSP